MSDDLVVNYRDGGELAGIELLGLHDDAIEQGRAFAAAHELMFPRDLGGSVVPA
jgi:hypothetical protein